MKLFKLLPFLLLVLAACRNQSADVAPPPTEYGITGTGGLRVTERYIPKVDIVFIVDNSTSMLVHQTKLGEGIDQFVQAIANTKNIDFHIGVMQIWDTERFKRIPPSCPDGRVNYEVANGVPLIGGLLPLRGPDELLKSFNSRFITRAPGFEQVLSASIKIGVNDLDKVSSCQKGPEVEEIFTPLVASFRENHSVNQGFWRPDSFKVFVILSDAYEGSANLTAADVDQNIRDWLGAPLKDRSENGAVIPQNKFRVYAVTVLPDQVNGQNGCKADPGFHLKVGEKVPDHPIAQLARLANGSDSGLLNICDESYGSKLLQFGNEIRKQTLKPVRINIDSAPNFNTKDLKAEKQFTVKIGSEVLKRGRYVYDRKTGNPGIADGDWDYRWWKDNNGTIHREVVVRGDLPQWDKNPNLGIHVTFAPVVRK